MLSLEEAIESWTKFEARSNTKRTKQIDRIKQDREFLSGKQWDDDDTKVIDDTRAKRTVNVLGNSVASTTNVYAAYPFKFYSPDEEADGACDAFLKAGSNDRAPYDALYSNVAFGLAYMAMGSEDVYDPESGELVSVPALYNVEKVENVYWDDSSVEIDGRDAMECGIVEYRSKDWVRAKYGPEFTTPKGTRAIVNTTDNKSVETMVIVTYYRMNKNKCEVYRLLNDRFLDPPTELNIDRLPVVPVYGERCWDGDDVVWQGLVRKGAPIQKLLNYAFTQLCERMAQAPKSAFITEPEAVEGYADGYRNFNRNINPLLLYNRWSPDHKIEYNAPIRQDVRVPFDDITGIISSNLELLSTITGVDAKGLLPGEQPAKTATEVMQSERQMQCTIRHFYANLKVSFKAIGKIFLQLLNMGSAPVDVIQGPENGMELQVARAELMQLMAVVPEDKRMSLVNGIFLSHPDNPVLRNVFGAINMNPGPTPIEMEQQDVIEQMKTAIEEKNQQIQTLQDDLKRMELNNQTSNKNLIADFVKMGIEHNYKQEDEILRAQLDQGLDTQKAAMENQKQQNELKKQAIDLDVATLKAISDIAKLGDNKNADKPQS